MAGFGGRIVKTTGDGLLLEFPSVVAAVECAIAIQKLMVERNSETPEARRIVYRIGVNLGDVLIEGDDILGDGVNIAARLEGLCEPGGVMISGAAHEHTRGKIDAAFVDLGSTQLKNIAEPIRVYSLQVGVPRRGQACDGLGAGKVRPAASLDCGLAVRQYRRRLRAGSFRRRGHGEPDDRSFANTRRRRRRPQYGVHLQGQGGRREAIGRELNVRYVLEGSVQRGGNRMRVNVQLIDAETGNHSGPSASTSRSPISSTCRTKSSRA